MIFRASAPVSTGRVVRSRHSTGWRGIRRVDLADHGRSNWLCKGAPWLQTTLVRCAWAGARTKGRYLQAQFQRLKVTAFASATRLVIGPEAFRAAEGDSEIVAARALLRCLDLKGQLVTADAIHCQKETAQLIRERGGDYLLRLKANHPALHEMVALSFDNPETRAGLATTATTDGDHGRIETRRAWVSHDLSWMRGPKTSCAEPVMLPGMACLGMIEASVERAGKPTVTRHYHVCSRTLAPAAYLHAARAHWSIENGLYWVLDVVFDEDRARNRKDNGPENLATPRKLALNVLNRARRDISVRRKRKRSG